MYLHVNRQRTHARGSKKASETDREKEIMKPSRKEGKSLSEERLREKRLKERDGERDRTRQRKSKESPWYSLMLRSTHSLSL